MKIEINKKLTLESLELELLYLKEELSKLQEANGNMVHRLQELEEKLSGK